VEALEILTEEHGMALRVAGAARRDVERVRAGGVLDSERARRLIDFFRYFTNSCHEPKEEDLLFRMLHRRGHSWEEPPLRDMVRQHEELRVVLDSATDWLPRAMTGARGGLESLLHDLDLYLDLLESHIAVEEDMLFPLARTELRPQDFEELGEAFSSIECDELDRGVHEYYAGVARRLVGAAA
jgi:hemerythrin-like domain-containing protein